MADLLEVPVESITNEHVFTMGEATKEKAAEFFRTADGINKVIVDDSNTFKSNREGDDRVLGYVFRNEAGQDIRTFMNNPLYNANYNSKFNIRGRAEFRLGSQSTVGDEIVSDFDAQFDSKGQLRNAIA